METEVTPVPTSEQPKEKEAQHQKNPEVSTLEPLEEVFSDEKMLQIVKTLLEGHVPAISQSDFLTWLNDNGGKTEIAQLV